MRFFPIFLVAFAVAQAQEALPPGELPSVRVHGEATVSAEPDQAEFDIGVVTQAATAKAASDQNAGQANALVQELRTLLPSADIKTVNFSVNPNYRYPKEGGPATITGYTANNTVRLLLNDISLLQKVIDVGMKAGGNSINRLTFGLRDEKAVRARALANAANQAESGAEALAASLKLKLGRLMRVEEGQPVIVSPAREVSFGKAQSTDMTPISPGTIDVHADVNLTYEILGGNGRE
ncbi:MAG: SIMPL domain-containing protein [Bryobacteraceae bacterium]